MITLLTHIKVKELAHYEGYMRRGLVHSDAVIAADRFKYEFDCPMLTEIYERPDGRYGAIAYEVKPKRWAEPIFNALNKIKQWRFPYGL